MSQKYFVTTRVNYGDSPAGCTAIGAMQETAKRFSKGREAAAWFLKNRTYVDEAGGTGQRDCHGHIQGCGIYN